MDYNLNDEYNEYFDEDFNQNEYYWSESEDNYYDIINDCIYPTLKDGFNHFLAPILISNLILRVLTLFVNNILINNTLTIGTGVSLLLYHLRDDYSLFAVMIAYISTGALVSLLPKRHKSIVWMICMSFICINESMVWFNPSFSRLRSHLMLSVMKIISFNAYITEELEKDHKKSFSNHFFVSISYLLHPLSLVLGVWHPFPLKSDNKSLLVSTIACIYYLLVSIVFLLLSTCLLHHYIGERLIPWIVSSLMTLIPMSFVYILEICFTVYITALQFRFSHYFICFTTQSMLRLWNSDLNVTNPMSIELPRSLVDVVVAWNIPMHIWLKTHVFNASKRKFGSFHAIFITYFISSFLHGFNFQIWSVLLSLGVLTKLEYDLREQLSKIYDSCIHVRRCVHQKLDTTVESNRLSGFSVFRFNSNPKQCLNRLKHSNTPFNCKSVVVVNIFFSLLAVSHLSYLGSTFDGKEESSKVTNVLIIWKELKFFSHFVSIFGFILYKII